ncbi:MAG TPA: glycosyltransferase [Candidatus Bathyarchaeia archaeon]
MEAENRVLIAWAPFSPTFEDIASELGGKIICLTMLFRKKWAFLLKYPYLTVRTLWLLHRFKPTVVVVQNPPVFAALTVLFGRFFQHYRVVIDHHCLWSMKTVTWPMVSQVIRWLEKRACRMADANFTPNTAWTGIFRSLGGKDCFTYHDYIPERILERRSTPPFLVVSSHGSIHRDEMLKEEAEALEGLKNHELFVTGGGSLKSHPSNVSYVGHLDTLDYEHLKENAHAALALTKELNTIPHVVHEYLAYGIPTIVLKNSLMHTLFSDAIVEIDDGRPEMIRNALIWITDPTVKAGICEAIRLNYQERFRLHERELAELRIRLNP